MNEVIEHLMFHKALGEDMDHYIELYTKAEKSCFEIKDEYDRSIAILFQLAIEERIDPWNIDLMTFSEIYLKRLNGAGVDFHFVYTGRIILLAWRVLKAQSNSAIEKINRIEEEPDLAFDLYSDFDSDFDMEPRAVRKNIRSISVFDIVKAMEFAKNIEIKARKKRKVMPRVTAEKVGENIHAEEIKSREVYNEIKKRRIKDADCILRKFGVIEGLIALLYLARDKKITLTQANFPYGKIRIKAL
jgi:segregation and condensation protein A